MKLLTALILLCSAMSVQANPFPNGNAQSGKALFDKYKCNSCHSAMVGGDGSAIFTRPNHKVRTTRELTEQIEVCSGNVGATLSAQEKQHLASYLNQYYKFQ